MYWDALNEKLPKLNNGKPISLSKISWNTIRNFYEEETYEQPVHPVSAEVVRAIQARLKNNFRRMQRMDTDSVSILLQ